MLVVLDADVLVPILTCDLLLTAAEAGLIQPIWSATILDEVRRNLIAIHPEIEPARLERRVQLMVDAFPDALVEGWEQQTESVPAATKAMSSGNKTVTLTKARGRQASAVHSSHTSCAPGHLTSPTHGFVPSAFT